MSRLRTIRQQAPILLEATKESLRYLLRQDPLPLASEEEDRQKLMTLLRQAIDAAEPPVFDERDTSLRLVMTPKTWDALHKILKDRAEANKDDRLVLDAVLEGLHRTKQRIYATVAINHVVLRRLAFILKHTATTDQKEPFKRMAKQIEEEGLTKNPMEILGRMGL